MSTEQYSVEKDPEMIRYWMKEGPKTAAFLLVIPGPALMGYGVGMLYERIIPGSLIGTGAGILLWGLVVALKK